MLKVTNGLEECHLTENQSIALELKLNVTSKGKVWAHIGDHLYNFGVKKPCEPALIVTAEQYCFLQVLLTRGTYKDCYDL